MDIFLLSPNQQSLPTLLDLSKKLHEHEIIHFDETYVSNAFIHLMENPSLGNTFFISIHQNGEEEIIGFVVICYSFSIEYGGQIAVIDQIYLSPQWRRQGVGTKLIPIIETHCKEHRCFAINIEVNIGNSGARKFYESFDYMPRRQHCIMSKQLSTTFN